MLMTRGLLLNGVRERQIDTAAAVTTVYIETRLSRQVLSLALIELRSACRVCTLNSTSSVEKGSLLDAWEGALVFYWLDPLEL